MKNHNSEKGAVFLYILLGISLLAALTYAVSSGNRTSTGALTGEQAKLAAQEIIDYGNTVANAVQKLRLRGCSDTEISFDDGTGIGYTNANSPTNKSCHIFDINGAGLTYVKSPEPYYFASNPAWRRSYGFMTGSEWDGNGSTCGSANCADIIMVLMPLDQAICERLNNLIGITGTPSATIGGLAFSGTHLYSNTISNALINSRVTACVDAGGGNYAHINLLYAR
jgi:hypothetical protein